MATKISFRLLDPIKVQLKYFLATFPTKWRQNCKKNNLLTFFVSLLNENRNLRFASIIKNILKIAEAI